MTPGVTITLIICVTILLIFGIALIGGSKTKQEKEILDYLKSDFPSADRWKSEWKERK